MSDLKRYPSGFVGSACVEQAESHTEEATKRSILSPNVGFPFEPCPYTANAEVVELWADQIAGVEKVNSFYFLEKVLATSLTAFGTLTLGDWVHAQADAGVCAYHHQWIEETLQFVFLGRPREYSYNVWSGLLDAASAPEAYTPSALFQDWVGPRGIYRNADWPVVIQEWVARPEGIRDLLESLNLLFGKH